MSHMLLIVGLGNPGKEYVGTRHNAGFDVVDALAERAGLKWKKEAKFKGEVAKGADFVLLKPVTFMNLSGESVVPAAQFYKIDTKTSIFVAHDELDLPVGAMKISIGSGPGGHNGVKSIIEKLGHKDFARFRVGIGKPADQTPIEDYVLRKPAKDEVLAIDRAVEAIEVAHKEGIVAAMNSYNTK